MRNVFARLYRTKMVLSCLILVVTGTVLMIAGHQGAGPAWLRSLPWNELGGILIGAGLLSVWLEHFLRREQEAIDDLRLRQLLSEQAPAMRDAVLEAFAANHQDLARVATPDMLDGIIRNSLALRLNDAQFAGEIYDDIRDQAIGASERWHDASLSIELSPLPMGKGAPKGSTRSGITGEFFAVTVRWEYKTVPTHVQRRFVCLSDRHEYGELAHERGATSAWYLKPGGHIDPSTPEAFELLRFAVNGDERPIRRAIRKKGQIYTATVGHEHVDAGQPVTISYTYRTITAQHGHLLFFDIEQPTKDLRVEFDYSGCGIASVSTLDLVPSVRPTHIEKTPAQLPDGVVRVDLDGWIFPRSGVAFVWTLVGEVDRDGTKQKRL